MVASVKDVAALAGVSPSTVSNYLHRPELLAARSRERVRAAIEELGYVPNESARQLRKGASKTIALILLDAWLPFYSDLSHGVEDAVRLRGWSLFFSNSGRDAQRELASIDMFESHRVQGVIISPQADVSKRLGQLQARGIQSVQLSPVVEAPAISSVGFDDIRGGQVAGEHLLSLGRRRIAFIGSTARISHSANRLAGLRAAIDAAAGPGVEVVLHPVSALDVEHGMRAAEEILAAPPDARPDAVFGANDMLALGALTIFLRAGVRVPEDVAIVGYDDVEYAGQAVVPLTSVRQPAYEMGYVAGMMLLEQITEADGAPVRHVNYDARLVARASTLGSGAP